MTVSATPDPDRWKALAVLGVAYLMVVLDVAIINVALPVIKTELEFASDDSLQWVVSGYALTFGGFLLLGGRIGDLLGRRKLFMAGLVMFAAFSLLCGFSTSSEMLIAARALQGAAGAILSPSVFSIVTVTFREGAERNKALGILGAIAGSGAAIGVLLGGVFTEYVGWEWIFYVNAPIAAVALLFVLRYVKESRAEGMERHFDVQGAATVTASLMLIVFALTRANTVGWGSGQTIGLLLGAAALMAAFVVIEQRSHAPLLPLKFFRHRTPTGANIIGFGLGTMVFSMFFLLSLYMQIVLGQSAIETGIGYLAVALTAILASGVAQALVTKFGVKPVLTLGMILLAVGLALFAQISVDGSYFGDLFIGFIVVGVGLGFSFVPISIAALAGIEQHEAGLASGLINTSQQIGGALGIAILTTASTSRFESRTADGVDFPAAAVAGYGLAFWVAFAFAIASLLITLVLLRRDELKNVSGAAHVG